MADQLVTGLLQRANLRVLVAVATDLAGAACLSHRLAPTSGQLLAQALCAGTLLAALRKDLSKINLQVECDGPLRGLFVDADPSGTVRGYVKNPEVNVPLSSGEFRWRPALGNTGFLSVLRQLKQGEPYRSATALLHFDLSRDLEEYFRASEQVASVLQLEALPEGPVAGVLVQALPGGDLAELDRLGQHLREGGLRAALLTSGGASAGELAQAVCAGAELELLSLVALHLRCSCSKDRVLSALSALGRAELSDIIAKEGKAETTCQFCGTLYRVSLDELRQLLAAVGDLS